MNAAQITHIFWKEYRTQRALWAAVVLLFLVTAVLTVLFAPEQVQPDVSSLLSAGFMTVTFYLLASTSILYASEKEQQTDVLLRTLPANPWLMLGVKSAWVVLSSLVAIGIFWLSAYLLAKPAHVIDGDLRFTVGLLFYLFCCTLVVSLFTRHVLSAIGISVALIFAFSIVGEVLNHRFFFEVRNFEYAYFTVVTISLLAISLELNRRWFRESDWTWRPGLRIGRAMTMQSALALPLEADGSARIWRRHLWREWHSVRVWVVGISAFVILLTKWWDPVPTAEQIRFLLFATTLVMIPLLFGVGSCRGDQAYDRYLCLGNRGESSCRLLLAKHTLWISSCLLLILFFQLYFWPDYLQSASNRQEEYTAGLRFVPIDSSLLSSARMEQLSGSMIPGIHFCAGVALLSYCLGHFFSLLIRQPVLSLAVAFMTGIFVTILVCLFYALDVPLFVLTVAPAMCLLALSFYRGTDWIIGNRSPASWKRLAFWWLLGPWTLISLLAGWRVAEIPFTTVDVNGLQNIPAFYFVGCAIGLVATLLVLLLADVFRRNFHDASGRPMFGARRWCTLGGVIGTFLLGHNLLLLAGSIVYSQYTTWLAAPMRLAVHDDISARGELDKSVGDLYQRADEKITNAFPLPEEMLQGAQQQYRDRNVLRRMRAYYRWNSWSDVTDEQRTWLEQNQDVLPLFFEADRNGIVESRIVRARKEGLSFVYGARPYGFLVNPRKGTNLDLMLLVRLQALKLEHEGRLGDAWKHHLAVVRYARRFADDNFPRARVEVLNWLNSVMLNGDLWRWQARKEQTPELLARAAEDLHNELSPLSPLREACNREGGWSLQLADNLSTFQLIAGEELLAAMPWERQRLRSLIIQQTVLETELAFQIDQGLVESSRGDFLFDEQDRQYYEFKQHVRGLPPECSIVLKTDPHGGRSPELLVVTYHGNPVSSASRVLPLPTPGGKSETTPLLMYAPPNTAVLGAVTQPLAESLQTELQFWDAVSYWLAVCPVYSSRAETGQFPADLNQLQQAPETRRLFEPVFRQQLDPRIGQRSGLLAKVLQIIWLGSKLSNPDYKLFHAGKWPQAEYNFGEPADRKPVAPLQAPKSREVQP